MCLLSFVNVSHISHVAQSCVTFDNVVVKLINVALSLNANNISRRYLPLCSVVQLLTKLMKT